MTDAHGSTWVRLADGAPATLLPAAVPAVPAALADLPGTTVSRVDAHTWSVRTKATKAQVRAAAGVATVADDEVLSLASSATATNDPLFYEQWALQNRGDLYINHPGDMTAGADADVTPAWAYTRGAGAVVAVIDQPVDFSNPDLAASLWTNPREACGATSDTDGDGIVGDCHGYDFGTHSTTDELHPPSSQPHGSHVAGIIAATAGNGIGIAGVASDAKVMPVAISDANANIYVSAAAAAVNYAVDHHASVINASWGGTGGMPSILQNAIDRAEAAGVVFVAAAGNSGVDMTNNAFWPASASNANVISVGASTPADGVASYSNYSATKVAVFAPGDDIVSTVPVSVNGGYEIMSGTSMAAPQVAGEAALLRSIDPTLTARQVKDRIMASAVRLPAFAGRSVSGGRIDTGAAVAALAGTTSPVAFTFDGFDALNGSSSAHPSVDAALEPSSAAAHPSVALSLTLATRVDGQVMAITDFPLTVTSADGTATSITTDATGTATLAGLTSSTVTTSTNFRLAFDLPPGTYALAAQFRDGAERLGTAGRVVFEVTDGSLPASSTTSTTVPGPATSPTTSPLTSPSTTAPPPATRPAPTTAPTTVPVWVPPATACPSRPATTVPAGPPSAPSNPEPSPTQPEAPTPTTSLLPAPPQAPTFLAGSASDGEVSLFWTAPFGDAVGYRVYENDDLIAQTDETAITIGHLHNGRAYAFSVSAYSAYGESGRTQPLLLAPNAPGDATTTVPATAPATTAPSTVPATTPATTPATAPAAGPPVTQPGPSDLLVGLVGLVDLVERRLLDHPRLGPDGRRHTTFHHRARPRPRLGGDRRCDGRAGHRGDARLAARQHRRARCARHLRRRAALHRPRRRAARRLHLHRPARAVEPDGARGARDDRAGDDRRAPGHDPGDHGSRDRSRHRGTDDRAGPGTPDDGERPARRAAPARQPARRPLADGMGRDDVSRRALQRLARAG